MTKIYRCEMTQTLTFDVKTSDETDASEVLDWLQTHDFEDVQKETTCYDIDWKENIIDIFDVDEETQGVAFSGIDLT